MSDYENKLTIKSWAEEDRPREKLLLKGKGVLTNAELLAILIGSGTRNESAVELCKRILKEAASDDLNDLGKLTVADLMKFKGIGEAKAVTIVAALELGRRRQSADVKDKFQIRTSSDIFSVFQSVMADLPHEEFWVLYLNRSNRVLSKERVSTGGVNGTVVDPKIVFRKAIEILASSVILCHNHPSGSLKPSQSDIDLTKQLRNAGESIQVHVVDHLIVADNKFFSFADEGMI